jgi:hypothetical protein
VPEMGKLDDDVLANSIDINFVGGKNRQNEVEKVENWLLEDLSVHCPDLVNIFDENTRNSFTSAQI